MRPILTLLDIATTESQFITLFSYENRHMDTQDMAYAIIDYAWNSKFMYVNDRLDELPTAIAYFAERNKQRLSV